MGRFFFPSVFGIKEVETERDADLSRPCGWCEAKLACEQMPLWLTSPHPLICDSLLPISNSLPLTADQ